MKFLPKSDFWSGVFTLTFGTGVSQLIAILISPLLTRIYSPDDFGLYGLYFSCSMVLSVLVCGRYEMAILLPKSDLKRYHILLLCFLVAFCFTIFLFIIVFFWAETLGDLLKNRKIGEKLIFIPITVFMIGISQSLNYWSNRKKEYINLSISKLVKSSSTSLMSLLFGITFLKSSGLILSEIVGQFTSSIFLFRIFYRKTNSFWSQVSFSDLKLAAIRYISFPKYHVVSGLFEKAAGNAPMILLTVFFSSKEAGHFALALKVISVPISLIAISIGDVFRQEASEMYAKTGNCYPIFKNTFKKLLIIAIPGFILGLIIIQYGFVWIFGNNWVIAGEYCKILLVMFFLQFTFSPLSSMFIIAEKQNIDMIKSIIVFFICIFVFWISKNKYNNSFLAIQLYVGLQSSKYIVEFILSRRYSQGLTNY